MISLSLTDCVELVGAIDVLNVYTGEATSTDYQTISITLGRPVMPLMRVLGSVGVQVARSGLLESERVHYSN
jgi:hypothetical protein